MSQHISNAGPFRVCSHISLSVAFVCIRSIFYFTGKSSVLMEQRIVVNFHMELGKTTTETYLSVIVSIW